MNKKINLLNNFLELIVIAIFYIIVFLIIRLKSGLLSPIEIRDIYAITLFVIFWFITMYLIKIGGLIKKELMKNERISKKISKRFKKKPLIFEYCFFLSLFWATGFLTVALSIDVNNIDSFLAYVENFALSIGVFGIAAAFGWEHYIEGTDREDY